jgi:hypothetical protein
MLSETNFDMRPTSRQWCFLSRSSSHLHSPFFRRSRASFFALALAFVAARADAHAAGLSQGDFALTSATHVDAHLVFAQPDAVVLARGETAPDLRDAALHGIEVLADGSPCAASYLGEAPVAGDALELHAAFDCPHPPHELVVSLPLLDELPAGHVHLVRLSSGHDHETQSALRSSGARATLLLSPRPPTTPWLPTAAVVLAGIALALVAFVRWRRTTRR